MRKSHSRYLSLVLALVLALAAALPVQAREWTTRGGTPARPNLVAEPIGLLEHDKGKWWRHPMGQSASQPVLIDQRVFHVAGLGLWRVYFDPAGEPQVKLVVASNAAPNNRRDVRVSNSTPTYSKESGFLYFGSAHGYLHAVNIRSGTIPDPWKLDPGCSVVSSPLVQRLDNRDIVIVGIKPKGEGCRLDEAEGKVYAVWGLDGVGTPGQAEFDISGWATPSAVPGPTPDTFFAGADGTDSVCGSNRKGQVAKLQIVPSGDGTYGLERAYWGKADPCVPNGVADGFVEANGYVYWVDKVGWLWGRRISDAAKPDGWDSDHIDLAAALGAPAVFTNMVPAVGPDGNTLYITLRNYATHEGANLQGTGCKGCTGEPGAAFAVDIATGAVHDPALLAAADDRTRHPSLNTNPLVLAAQNAWVYADVNGTVYFHSLASGQGPAALMVDDQGRPVTEFSLLDPGEKPMRVAEHYGQGSGAGTEPAVGSGTLRENDGQTRLLVGVNVKPPPDVDEKESWKYGRLVAIPVGLAYNLRWTDGGSTDTTGPWSVGSEVTVKGTVTLERTDHRLGDLRYPPGVAVTWYLQPKDWDYVTPVRRLDQAPTMLPAGMRPGDQVPVQVSFTVGADDPEEGTIVGVIDAARLGQAETWHSQRLARKLMGPAFKPDSFAPANSGELVLLPDGGSGLADNFVEIPFQKKRPLPDLAAGLQAPDQVDGQPGSTFAVTWTVTNVATDAGATAGGGSMVPWRITVSSDQGRQWTGAAGQLAPPAPGQAASGTAQVPLLSCGDGYHLRFEVNFPLDNGRRVLDEVGYDNNAASATTAVGACPAPPPPGQGSGGGSITVIVPPDCEPNPDLTSDKPCLNYDLRIPNWHR